MIASRLTENTESTNWRRDTYGEQRSRLDDALALLWRNPTYERAADVAVLVFAAVSTSPRLERSVSEPERPRPPAESQTLTGFDMANLASILPDIDALADSPTRESFIASVAETLCDVASTVADSFTDSSSDSSSGSFGDD
jgi:hypothetical protein